MTQFALAQEVGRRLGGGAHARENYTFLLPSPDTIRFGTVDAALFSSPVASINTALVGFVSTPDARISEQQLEEYAYLGAPLLVASSDDRLDLYEYRGSPVPRPIGDTSTSEESTQWVRERLVSALESPQLSLSLSAGRELLLRETRGALGSRLSFLMQQAQSDLAIDESDSFAIAIGAVRRALFGQSTAIAMKHGAYVRMLSGQINPHALANLPPEAVAELYESFAVSSHQKRRHGVVYTPAWLARYVIDRLPPDAVASGKAVDPACGSGTFLVCYLERLVEHEGKRGVVPNTEKLAAAVGGVDIDIVATEAARLSLDIFARNIGVGLPSWDFRVADATSHSFESEWIIGNLPFGYRTHRGKEDLAAAIFRNIHETNERLRAFSLILPDSIAYTESASSVRQLLRTHYRIEEVTRLPESTFEFASTKTMVVMARKAVPTDETLVREVATEDLKLLRTGTYASRSFFSRLPIGSADRWQFSPFSNEFERAEKNGVVISSIADARIGLQLYGSSSAIVKSAGPDLEGVPLLDDPAMFARWSGNVDGLPRLIADRHDVRRAGPWERYPDPKLILRATVFPGTLDRLAAIADRQGLWFTDKFVGVWPQEEVSLNGLAAYFQTRFARAWFETANPSRKLRIAVIGSMPIPRLPAAWWERASALANDNLVVRPPQTRDSQLDFGESPLGEWEWFNSAVEAALGLDTGTGSLLDEWLLETKQVAR